MPISVIQTWNAATTYLEELRSTIQGDVRPLLNTGGKAPFAICREVFSYVDHLGHLYAGEIYEMFRNGPVHVCLLEDLEAALTDLPTMGPPNERVTCWNRAARELIQDKPHEFVV